MYRAALMILALTFFPSLAAAQQPCTTDESRVVTELYRHMLERSADSSSAHWAQELRNGRSVRDVVREIANSPEHLERFWKQEAGEETPFYRSVGVIYRHLLSRQPDAAGARAWAELGARNGAGAVINQILNSNEYNSQFGDWGVPGSGGLRYCGPNNQGAVSTPASAPQTANNRVAARFQAMDRNTDGVITRTEWQGTRQTFDTTDVNGDGVLAGAEVRDGAGRRGRGRGRGLDTDDLEDEVARTRRFEALDVNGNGRVESREWQGTVAAFNRLDVNNDNTLSRNEVVDDASAAVAATSGNLVTVDSSRAWTDTGLTVRAGETIFLQADGAVRLSDERNDIADPGGSRLNRRAVDAPLPRTLAGGLIARIGNSAPIFVGDRQSFRVPASGRLYLGVNDDFHGDNTGQFQVTLDVQGR